MLISYSQRDALIVKVGRHLESLFKGARHVERHLTLSNRALDARTGLLATHATHQVPTRRLKKVLKTNETACKKCLVREHSYWAEVKMMQVRKSYRNRRNVTNRFHLVRVAKTCFGNPPSAADMTPFLAVAVTKKTILQMTSQLLRVNVQSSLLNAAPCKT